MNSSMAIDSAYGLINDTAAFSAREAEKPPKDGENCFLKGAKSSGRDTFEKTTYGKTTFGKSAEAYEAAYEKTYGKEEKLSASSGKDTLRITRSSKDRNTLVIHFRDSAEISRTIARGYLTVNGVRVDLPEDVKNRLQETDSQARKDREDAFYRYTLLHDLQAARQMEDAMREDAENMAKMMEIASRIAKGGKVPPKDEQKLMQYSPELYALAKSAAAMAKKREKYESLLDGEEGQAQEHESAPDEASCEAPDALTCKTYETQMGISMEGGAPQIQEISEAEMDFL